MAYLNVFINNSNKNPINVNRDTKPVPPGPDIDKWVKEHMVFWYDMSKPVDVYVPGVTYANPFVNGGGKLTYDNAINKCIITHTPTNNNNIAFWQIIVKPLQYVESYKIRVTGLPTGFTIKGRLGYDDIQIASDGEYDIPEYRNSHTTNTSYPGFYLAGDNVNDVDCNIVVEEIPTKQSVPTQQTDGFTEQDLIDYVLENLITQ